MQVNIKHLEVRERELEFARRQLRDMTAQMEQRESIQKKTQLVNQLVEKEGRLKNLVKEQERMETEIREREEAMRRILTEQEAIEKEIIEGKQAQRHLLEQSKKERFPRVKIRKADNENSSPEETLENPGNESQS